MFALWVVGMVVVFGVFCLICFAFGVYSVGCALLGALAVLLVWVGYGVFVVLFVWWVVSFWFGSVIWLLCLFAFGFCVCYCVYAGIALFMVIDFLVLTRFVWICCVVI